MAFNGARTKFSNREVARSMKLVSGRLGLELHADRAQHAQDGAQLSLGIAAERLIEAGTAQPGISGDLCHALGPSNGSDRGSDCRGVAVLDRCVEKDAIAFRSVRRSAGSHGMVLVAMSFS